jgi:hypothetical protein
LITTPFGFESTAAEESFAGFDLGGERAIVTGGLVGPSASRPHAR